MKAYRIVDRSNSQLLRDSLIRNGQILLPMVELIEARSKGTLLTYRRLLQNSQQGRLCCRQI